MTGHAITHGRRQERKNRVGEESGRTGKNGRQSITIILAYDNRYSTTPPHYVGGLVEYHSNTRAVADRSAGVAGCV